MTRATGNLPSGYLALDLDEVERWIATATNKPIAEVERSSGAVWVSDGGFCGGWLTQGRIDEVVERIEMGV